MMLTQIIKVQDIGPQLCSVKLITMNGAVASKNLPVSRSGLIKRLREYNSGDLIQQAFDVLNNEEREFLMTGLTPGEWEYLGENNE